MRYQLSILSLLVFNLFLYNCEGEGFGTGSDDATDPGVDFGAGEVASSNTSNNGQGQEPGLLTAGEWNDLENWDFWTNLMAKDTLVGIMPRWSIFPEERVSVKVVGDQGQALNDCLVQLINGNEEVVWTARTDNFGKAELWVNLFTQENHQNLYITTECGGFLLNTPKAVIPGPEEQLILLNANYNPMEQVDISFVVDATASMVDEIEYLKIELNDVISRIKGLNPSLNYSLSTVFYRDVTDEYLTRPFPFTGSTAEIINFISQQAASGGGNYPEAVKSALVDALNFNWSESAKARILFLLLDAPPHHNGGVIQQLHTQIEKASALGIKIIPITASGIDKETEFLMRLFAIVTNGTYVFITDDSGIGNDHIEATVGEFEVEFLNDLMVRLVKKYIE